LIRIGLVFWAGWLVMHAEWGSISLAALAGPLVTFFDHILLGAIIGTLTADYSRIPVEILQRSSFQNPRTAYLVGILISYVMFLPVAACISAGAGYIARKFSARLAT